MFNSVRKDLEMSEHRVIGWWLPWEQRQCIVNWLHCMCWFSRSTWLSLNPNGPSDKMHLWMVDVPIKESNYIWCWQMHGWDGARLEGMNELHDLLGATSYLWTKHIPHICHRHHRRCLCKKTLPGVNFYRFLLCKLAIYCVHFGVNFILQKICMCKKSNKYQVWTSLHFFF